ncbi:MAG: hypothetical protein AAF499_05950 [Pseudomonadota bacterium]
MPAEPITVETLLLPQCNLILVSALTEPLRAANRLMGESRFHTHLLSLDGEAVETTAGLSLPVSGRFDPGQAAPLLVAASYGIERQLPGLRHPMRRAARHRPFIAAADGAVRLLAEAGVYNAIEWLKKTPSNWPISSVFKTAMLGRSWNFVLHP